MDDALRFNERLCLMECNVNRRFGEERNSERVKGGYLTASSGENVYASALEQAEDYICDNAELLAALDIREVALSMLKPLGMGEHNKNFWFAHPTTGEKFVLRVNVASQPFHDDQVAYEFVALEALAKSGRVPRPVYLDNSSAALGKGVLVESFCEGDMLDFDHLRPGDLRCAAQIMADVHAVAVSRDCPLHRPSDPLRGLMEECVERFDVYRRSAFEDSRITSWTRRFLEASQRALDTAPPPRDREHIVNTETLPSHFLIPAASALQAAANDVPSGIFCANPGYFVDWERPIVGEVAQDVAYFVSPTTTFWDMAHDDGTSQHDVVLPSARNVQRSKRPQNRKDGTEASCLSIGRIHGDAGRRGLPSLGRCQRFVELLSGTMRLGALLTSVVHNWQGLLVFRKVCFEGFRA